MRKKCWSLFLRLMIKSPVSPWESPILTITIFPLLFNYHLLRTIKLKCRLHLWTFSNSLKHKSFSFSATNCKTLCPTFSLTWSPNSAMCFHCIAIVPGERPRVKQSHKVPRMEAAEGLFCYPQDLWAADG